MTATNDASFKTELSAEQKAHETSMDDILASIRRIIADDDALPLSRRARDAAPSAPARAAAPGADAFVSLGERLTRRSAPVEPESSVAPGPAVPAPGPPLLKLRRFAPGPDAAPDAADKSPSAREASSEQVAAEPDSPLELRPSLAEAETADDPPSASVVTLVQPSAQAVESRLKIGPLAFRAPAFKPAPEKPGRDDVKPAAPVPTPPAAEEASEPALLSPASGAKIGASFEALAESLLLRDPRMIERLAREMLRPMLKEWLDDHLPDVVERLVRAEIERIARGGV